MKKYLYVTIVSIVLWLGIVQYSNVFFCAEGAQTQLIAPWIGSAKITQGNNGSTSHYDSGTYDSIYAIDVRLDVGSDVLAPADGVVRWYDPNPNQSSGGGIELAIDHTDTNGGTFTTVYLHLSAVIRTSGSVKQGEVIAKSGDTGNVTGPHLHFHIWGGSGNQQLDSHTAPIERLVMKQVGVDNDFREYDARNGDLEDNKIAWKFFESPFHPSKNIYVKTTGNDTTGDGSEGNPYKTIQKGIDSAFTGDIVIVADGTYKGDGNKNLDFKGKAITVKSQNGAAKTIIDCENNGRGFYFHSGETSSSVLEGFTITKANFGGIYCSGSSPIIQYNRINENTTDRGGGGIWCDGASPTIEGNEIIGNRADDTYYGYGGGIYCSYSSPKIINNNKINKNWATMSGGGIRCEHNSSPLIQNNEICENGGYYGGGGIYLGDNDLSDNSPLILNNKINKNYTHYNGGGIMVQINCLPMIKDNEICENTARSGGGIHCTSPLKIANNLIAKNSALLNGGGIFIDASSLNLVNNTIVENSAVWPFNPGLPCKGGGIYFTGSSMTITNTIFWNNEAVIEGNQIYIENLPIVSITYSDIQDGWIGEGNISSNPFFINADNNDYRLKYNSPCIGAGMMTADVPTTDKNGISRPTPSNSKPDIGAYESSFGQEILKETITTYLPTNYQQGLGIVNNVNLNIPQQVEYANSTPQTTLKTILNWGGSEMKLEVYKPDGTLYGQWQSSTPPIIVDIPDTEIGGWKFIVTAIDIPYEDYPFALVVGTPASSITLNLLYGWNLISCPGDPVISDIAILTANNPNIPAHAALVWDPVTLKKVITTTLEFGKCYFFAVTGSTQLTIEYYPRDSMSLPLKYGWNGIGSLSSSVPTNTLTSDPSGKIPASVIRWDTATQKKIIENTIEPGVGYLIPATADCTLAMNCSSAAPKQILPTKPSWEGIVSIHTQKSHEELVFGMNRSASDNFDVLYDVAIPPFFESVGSINAGWLSDDPVFGSLNKSFVSDASAGSWELSVTLTESGELSWRNLPKSYRFELLYDNQTLKMNTVKSLQLPVGEHRLKIFMSDIPKKTNLLLNYPNPFNPETWIPFELSIDTKVEIMIYNSTGQLVRKLDLGHKQAGRYINKIESAYWDGKNEAGEVVSSGIYFYSLVTPDFSQTRKLVIIR
jgi:hypothetical protein